MNLERPHHVVMALLVFLAVVFVPLPEQGLDRDRFQDGLLFERANNLRVVALFKLAFGPLHLRAGGLEV